VRHPHEPDPIGRPRVVVIGASAGGVETLLRVVSGLPADLNASVCIVLHLAPGAASSLPAILQRRSRLPCRAAVDGEPLCAGQILVGPPDHHLTIEDGHVVLTVGPRENGHRPSIDALFRTAAAAQGGRVIGVVLSGTRDDGTAGLAVIKAAGGTALVQDPEEAIYPGMPASALAAVAVDMVATSERMAAAIVEAVNHAPPERPDGAPAPGPSHNPGHSDRPSAEHDPDHPVALGNLGLAPEPDPSTLAPPATTCPECGGVLTERTEAGVAHWECRVGHRYSPESLADAQAEGVEAALWAAIRALEDRAALLERLGGQAEERGFAQSAHVFFGRAREAEAQAGVVRTALAQAASTTLQAVEDSEEVESDRRRLG
jgi:two-component system, chemotaxis family, protein-glutamate methylesterase/glutaminase